jgi:Na+-driven multidrug efflux pump
METTRLALIIMSAAGLVFFIFPHVVVGLFSREEVVHELALRPLRVLALAQPALAYIVSLTGGLRGAGDTRWVMCVTLLHMLVLRLALTLFLVWLGLGLVGVWLAMLIESYSRAVFFAYRFRRKIPSVELLLRSH